jgi:hypothetical protein
LYQRLQDNFSSFFLYVSIETYKKNINFIV